VLETGIQVGMAGSIPLSRAPPFWSIWATMKSEAGESRNEL